MWKRRKLLTLILAAIVLVPLAWSLLPSLAQTGPQLGYEDSLLLNLSGAQTGQLAIDSSVDSTDQAAGTHASLLGSIDIRVQDGKDPLPTSYLTTQGRGGELLRDCRPISDDPVPKDRLELVSYNDLPPDIQQPAPPTPSDLKYYKLHGQISCAIAGKVWVKQDEHYKLRTPVLAVSSPTASTTTKRDSSDSSPDCANIALRYGPEITVDYQAPTPIQNTADAQGDPSRPPTYWSECLDPNNVNFNELGPIDVSLTDTKLAREGQTKIFFAGALVGVLGGLVIEIIVSGFEVAESRSARRDEEEQQRPYDPSPRGYL